MMSKKNKEERIHIDKIYDMIHDVLREPEIIIDEKLKIWVERPNIKGGTVARVKIRDLKSDHPSNTYSVPLGKTITHEKALENMIAVGMLVGAILTGDSTFVEYNKIASIDDEPDSDDDDNE